MAANKQNQPQDNGKRKRFKMPNIGHIVIHSTASLPHVKVHDLGQTHYHYVIDRDGKAIKFKDIESSDKSIDIAMLGGLDKSGQPCDNRTSVQNDTLFRVIVQFSDIFPKAGITGADQVYEFTASNPGFDVKQWLGSYIPEFLQAA